MVCVVAIALGSSTHAWFASNNSVKAEKMNVTITANVKFLEIQNAKGTIKKPLSLSPWFPTDFKSPKQQNEDSGVQYFL